MIYYFLLLANFLCISKAEFKVFDWLVSIQVENRHICSGAYVEKQIILTAARCLDNRMKSNKTITINVFGNDQNVKKIEVDPRNIVIHPDWSEKSEPRYLKGDLAVIFVPEMISDTAKQEIYVPIKLPAIYYYPNGECKFFLVYLIYFAPFCHKLTFFDQNWLILTKNCILLQILDTI